MLQAVTDSPCVNFSDELLAAYPNAKVVLTTRDPDKWLASMHSSFHRVLDAPSWNVIAAFDTVRTTPSSSLDMVFSPSVQNNLTRRPPDNPAPQ